MRKSPPLQASLPTRLRKQAQRLSHRYLPGERMLPSYLIIGVKRGATTALSEYLNQHPDVLVPYVPKGPRYFDVNHQRGWPWYETHFPTAATGARQQRQTGVAPIVGDASPYIVFHPLALERVRAELPDAKLILSLRDPVVRAWSQYNYEHKRGWEELDPQAAFDAEPERLAGEEDRIRADERYVSDAHRHHAYLVRGRYADQIRHVRSLFPAEQLHLTFADDLEADLQGAYDALTDFLGLRRYELIDPQRFKVNSYEPMEPALRRRLAEYYAGPNEDLFGLLGRRLDWISP